MLENPFLCLHHQSRFSSQPSQPTTRNREHISSKVGTTHTEKNWSNQGKSFLLAIEADPENPWVYIQHGDAEFEYGHVEEARIAWRKAKKRILPTQVELHTLLNNKIELAEH